MFLLCGHAASAPGDLPLVAATLDWVAALLRYPHRHAYAAWHQRALLYHWVSAGYSLQHWMAVQRLVAPTWEAAAGDTRTFLAACAPALVSTIVYGQQAEDLGLLATALNKGGWAGQVWLDSDLTGIGPVELGDEGVDQNSWRSGWCPTLAHHPSLQSCAC